MIAAISLMRRLDTVTLGRFRRHWLDVHGPLVCAFEGLATYVQCHVVPSPVMNDLARSSRIDGFPILFFATDEDRTKAQGLPEMAACNVDSRLFIGAVARIASETETVIPRTSEKRGFSLLSLFPEGTEPGAIDADIGRQVELPHLRGLTRYHVRGQGRAPASTIPHLPVTAAGVSQASFDTLVDLECALEAWSTPAVARFVVEEHWLA